MFKKVIAAFIALLLILSAVGAAFADNDATTLTDIDKHWAKQHIVNVYSKGFMDAAEGSQFKPDEKIKRYDVIVGISRMMRADKVTDLTALVSKYQKDVLDKYNVPTYARQAVAFCIEKQIITIDDVKWFQDYPFTNKIDASVYLGRAFGIKYEAGVTPAAVLSFTDKVDIPALYQTHVEFLVKIGVVDGKGDANGKFNPYTQLTRAIFAKMLDQSNSTYEKDYLKLEEPAKEEPKTETPVEEPKKEDPPKKDGVIPAEGEVVVEGYAEDIIPEYGVIVIGVKQKDNTTVTTTFNIPSYDISCTIDEVKSSYWKIKKGDVVTLLIKDGEITKLVVESKIQKTKAVIKDIRVADKIVIEVQTEKGDRKSYALTTTTKIIKDEKEAKYTDLKVGMSLTIISIYQELIEINADVTKTNDRGIVESISFSRTAPAKLVIKKENGERAEYYVKADIANENILIEGKVSTIYDIRPNMMIDISLENEEISKLVTVVFENKVSISGVVKSINYDFGIIKLEYTDLAANKKVEKTIFALNSKIVDTSLNPLVLKDIKEGTKLSSIFGKEDLTLSGIIAETIIIDK